MNMFSCSSVDPPQRNSDVPSFCDGKTSLVSVDPYSSDIFDNQAGKGHSKDGPIAGHLIDRIVQNTDPMKAFPSQPTF